MSVCDLCLSVINACLGNDCVALISSFDGIFCARCLCAGSLYAEWLSSGGVSRISALYECLFRMSDCYVFVMGACRGSLFCMSVCIMYVCRIYILDVCVWLFGYLWVWHISVCLMPEIWNVCMQNVCDQCLFGEWLCGFNSGILFVMGSFVLDASVRDLRMLNGWDQFVCLQDFCNGWMFIG